MCIVFVHGIFSDGTSCWSKEDSNKKSHYWPEILSLDSRFPKSSIFIGEYYTAIDSGEFTISDAAKSLMRDLCREDSLNQAPIQHSHILFICHSTGGIITRSILEKYREKFKETAIGLLLIASPSLGSTYADYVSGIARIYNQKMGSQLASECPYLDDLDQRFKDLVDERYLPKMIGLEAFETSTPFRSKIPSILRWLIPNRGPVVSRRSAGRYFSAPTPIPGHDHFSIVKPTSTDHPAHVLLLDFVNHFVTLFPLKVSENRSTNNRLDFDLSVEKEFYELAKLPQLSETFTKAEFVKNSTEHFNIDKNSATAIFELWLQKRMITRITSTVYTLTPPNKISFRR